MLGSVRRFGDATFVLSARVVDVETQQVMLVGGQEGGVELDDVWLWDGTNWTQQGVLPSPRSKMAVAAAHAWVDQQGAAATAEVAQ